MISNKNNIECIECRSNNIELLEGKVSKAGVRVNDLWYKCKNCGKESPISNDEIELANKLLAEKKQIERDEIIPRG